VECDGTTSLWLTVNSAPSQRPRIRRQGIPWPAEQSVRPRSENCVLPQRSKEKPAGPSSPGAQPETSPCPGGGKGRPAHHHVLKLAENAERVNAGWPAYEEALKKAGVQYTAHHYPGTNHGFHNDTTPRYDEAAAKLAWQRTVEFFNKELGGK
jgi:hypothetical protein